MAESFFSKPERVRWAILLVTASLLVYANGITGGFTYDDKAIVRDNPRIQSPRNLPQIFSTSYFGGPRGSGTAYRPILLLSYAVQWWIHGREVIGFHVVNVLLHATATLLLAALLLRVGVPPPMVVAAALLFAVHPIHVEAVTSLVGRGEALATAFVLVYLHLAVRIFGDFRLFALLLALAFYALAVLTKESAAAAPALAFLLFFVLAPGGFFRRARGALVGGVFLYAGSAAVLAGVFALRSSVLGGYLKSPGTGIFEVENALDPLPPTERIANACVIFLRYLGRSLLPLHLSADESAWSIRVLRPSSFLALTAVLLLAVMAGLALARLASGSPIALGVLFFCVALLPAGNLLFTAGTIFAERLAYMPSAGICLVIAALLAGRAETLDRLPPARLRALAAVTLLFATRTVVRNAVWWSDEALFANTLRTSPGSAKAHYNTAYVSAQTSQREWALLHYSRAVEIYEGYWDAWAGKGRVEKELGRLEEAERSYMRSIKIHPAYENGYFGLGLVREARGDNRGAEEAYRLGLKQKADSPPLAYRLARLRSRLGIAGAMENWRRALALGPDAPAVRVDFAAWLMREGKTAEAVHQAREALRRDPFFLPALRLLAEKSGREGMTFSEGLAREKAFRVSRSAEDLVPLLRIARSEEAYGRRFAQLRPSLERLSPRAFRERSP